jgi:hypothetical protein
MKELEKKDTLWNSELLGGIIMIEELDILII